MNNARFIVLAFVAAILALATAPATPTFAATFTVNSTGDAGDATPGNGVCATAGAVCTLRAAIQESNALAGFDAIDFNIPAGSAGCVGAVNPVCTITPASALTSINEQVRINGYTQPGAFANHNPIGSASDAVLKIELNGTSAGVAAVGLNINIGSGTEIAGLAINRFGGVGVVVGGSGAHEIQGNYLGTDIAGGTDLGNGSHGVNVSSGNNSIGGITAPDRNVISGNNGNGITITGASASSNFVGGNFIGLNAAGAADLGNSLDGIQIGSFANNVGGATITERNVISGNDGDGIELNGASAVANTVQGNYIGTNISGTGDLGNTSNGVLSLGTGQNIIGGTTGVTIGGPCTGVCNVVSGNDGSGVNIQSGGAGGTFVQGNYIGTDVNGVADLGNTNVGVRINGVANNTVGGTASGARNLISGNNSTGVEISSAGATGNLIQGNYIGTDINGNADLGNSGDGVFVNGSGSNTVGGSSAAARNIISGNNARGIAMSNLDATANVVQGNYIGTKADGVSALGNTSHGIHLFTSTHDNTFGGVGVGQPNVIAHNGGDGVFADSAGTGNSIRGNSMHSNTGLGIDLGTNGVTANDAGDPDTGANNLQNFPVLTAAIKKGGGTLVQGSFDSDTSGSYSLDFYANSTCDSAGNGEGARYLGSLVSSGSFTFFPTVGATALGEVVTATATRDAAPLDTSEFSNCVPVGPMVVDTTSDSSLTNCRPTLSADCSLRGAITNANTDALADTINFNIPGCPGGICTITPGSALPTITAPITIDGYTQPSATANTNDTSAGLNAALKIELNGTSAGAGVSGLSLTGGDSTVRGLAINRFTGNGITITTGSNNAVAGNYIGTNVAGDTDLGNGVDGVQITTGSGGNCVGGTFVSSVCTATPATRNLISGNNDDGVHISSAPTPNLVKGNIIGLNAAGAADLGNTGEGIAISSSVNTIGGSTLADRNIISGNDSFGIVISSAVGNNGVFGNYIGTDVTGNLDRGNTLTGVATGGTSSGADIGGIGGSRNLISGNDAHGVSLSGAANENATVYNNYIGTNAAGSAAVPNSGDGVIIATGGNNVGFILGFGIGNLISGNLGNGVRINGTNGDDNHVWDNKVGTAANPALPLKNGLHGVLLDTSADLNHIGLAPNGSGAGNTIAFNGGDGVRVDGAATINNTVRGNSIHSNVGKGIENINGGNGEPGHAPPVITSAGSAAGTACANCTVDVYSDGGDEGRIYHGSVVANGAGAWTFAGAVTGPNITATAMNAGGSTSEFPTTPFTGCADTDADMLCNSGDACPTDSDCDNDGWSDGIELAFLGTDYQDACPDNTLDNAWPPDVTNNGFVDTVDIAQLTNLFGIKVTPNGPAPARYDLAPDPPVVDPDFRFIDTADIVKVTNLFGVGCVP